MSKTAGYIFLALLWLIFTFLVGIALGDSMRVDRYADCRKLTTIERCVEHVGLERKR